MPAASPAQTLAIPSTGAPRAAHPSSAEHDGNETRTAHAFDAARARGPLALYAFLYGMPKGGDLHNHLYGAVYAESWIRSAAEDHLCVDVKLNAFLHAGDRMQEELPPHCEPDANAKVENGRFPAASLANNQPLYDALIDAFSMRNFIPNAGESGHDHFFNSFAKFDGPATTHTPEWIDEIATRAAAQNEQYIELMQTPPFLQAAKLAVDTGFTTDYAAYRKKMLDGGLRDEIAPIQKTMDGYMASRRTLERCDTTNPAPACSVTIRFEYQVLRNFPPPVVFAQILLGFEVAAADPQHFLSINLVQPEDAFYAMRDYRMHMQMIAALRHFYPSVHVTLHAGELAPGLVPPEGLTFHIRDAVETAGAERIGHGVDVMYEDDARKLLREMADKHVMVEINLTSNDSILNVFGEDHPLLSYLAAGVPVALSTDDEGVNRSNMTHEYARAASTYPLTYQQMKSMTRNSIAYGFLPGEPLWPVADARSMYSRPVSPCASSIAALSLSAVAEPASACAALLKSSEKAAQQWELERRFAAFEAQWAK